MRRGEVDAAWLKAHDEWRQAHAEYEVIEEALWQIAIRLRAARDRMLEADRARIEGRR